MDLFFKAGDVIKLTWLPEELLPNNHIISKIDGVKINIRLHQLRDRPLAIGRDRSLWFEVFQVSNKSIVNSGSFEFTVPQNLLLEKCLNQNQICPVAFSVTAVVGTKVTIAGAGKVTLPAESAGIWSAVGYFQADKATAASLSNICSQWGQPSSENKILTSKLRQLPACPPRQRQAALDARFREETSQSIFSSLITRYEEGSRRFYTPMARICYVLIVMEERFGSATLCC